MTTLSIRTAPTLGMIGEKFTGGLGSELNESPSKEDTRSSITGSPAKLTDGSKSSDNLMASIEIDAETSLPLSSAISH
ncbi:hypothetical protein AYI68_g5867 [Smittium mucronatum]|uniref:Uncharacterized protein n=1 Tax=Smittium mucronatum TaxID=133383 RepID=A0A1R0GT26_9FUNG|nr:hypothetical protein AYI68_g5867 [Smittium mucronatum]